MANYRERGEKMSTAKKTLSVNCGFDDDVCYSGRIGGRDER